jgi:thiol:disulfide interchange protein DsbD
LGFFANIPPSWAAIARVDVIHSQNHYPAGGAYPLLFRVEIPGSWYVHGNKQGKEGLIPTVLSFLDSPGLKVENIEFPPPSKKKFEYAKRPVEVFSGKILVKATLVINEPAPLGTHVIKGQLSYQACTVQSCIPPETVPVTLSFSIAQQGARVELKNQEMFESHGLSGQLIGSGTGLELGSGLLLTLVGIFLGGLALNLTPCIYPLIPITVSFFGGRSGKMRGRSVAHGIFYIAGLAITNSVLGVTASLSGGMLGSTLQNPIVLIVMAGILVSLGLSFFGLWEFHIPVGLTRLASKNFGGYFGTFFMGLTLGILAAPCLGPFILGLLTYVSQKGDPLLGFLYFFVLSIGLGLPLSVLAVFSGGLKKLPMSGEWMIWISKLLGWVLVGMAGYMLLPLIPGAVGKSALMALIFLAAGLHLGWRERSRSSARAFPYIKKGLGVALIGVAIVFFLTNSRTREGVKWIPYDQTVLIEAAKRKKPVILDFYADWCEPCKALDKGAFSDPDVVRLSKDLVTVRVDLTTKHPQQDELQERYQIIGVPTVIFINRRGVEERKLRIESYVTRDVVRNRMKGLLEQGADR